MALTQNQILKGELKQKISSTAYDVLYPKTSGDVVTFTRTGTSTVSDVETQINNILDIIVAGGGSIFWVQYGTTTYAQITSALAADQFPACLYQNKLYILTTNTPTTVPDISGRSRYHFASVAVNHTASGDWDESWTGDWTIQAFDVDTNNAYKLYDVGFAHLDTNKKILISELPDVVLGQLVFGGTVAIQSTGAHAGEALATLSTNGKTKMGLIDAVTTAYMVGQESSVGATTVGWKKAEGVFFIASNSGNFVPNKQSPSVTIDFQVGDWLLSTGTGWEKIDNTDAVTSVDGKIGDVTVDVHGHAASNGVKVNTADNKTGTFTYQADLVDYTKDSNAGVYKPTTILSAIALDKNGKLIAYLPNITTGAVSGTTHDAVTGVSYNSTTGNYVVSSSHIQLGNITYEGKLDKSLHAVTTDASGTIIAEDLSVSDPSVGSTPGSSFIATISQDATGQISATKQNVQLGNITHEGKLQSSDVAIANGDKLVITDASNSNKIARSSLAFDGSTINQFLSKKGTWQTVDPNSILWFNYNSVAGTISGTTGADIAGAITAGKWPVAKDENGFMYELASHTVITGGAEDVDRFTFAGIINNAGMLFLNYFIIDSVSGTTVVSKGQIPFLASTGVAAGNYSAVAVNSDGLVTEGKQAIMVLDKTATPADPDSKLNSLATYGWYFEATAKG